MVRIQRLTSARPGEICSMVPADIDRTEDVWIYRPVEYKTEHFDKDRVIAIGPRAQKVLAPYLADRDPNAFCFSLAESEARRRAAAAAGRKTPLSCGKRPNGAASNVKIVVCKCCGKRMKCSRVREGDEHEKCHEAIKLN